MGSKVFFVLRVVFSCDEKKSGLLFTRNQKPTTTMSVQFFNNSALEGKVLASKSCVAKGVSELVVFHADEDLKNAAFWGDDGSAHFNLASLKECASFAREESEEEAVDRALAFSSVVAKVAARGEAWAKAAGWK